MGAKDYLMIEQKAWNSIAASSRQPEQYFAWCRRVVEMQLKGDITIPAAARMIAPRPDARAFERLTHVADIQIVMDYVSDIADGAAYVGAEDSLRRDWAKVTEIVSRHL